MAELTIDRDGARRTVQFEPGARLKDVLIAHGIAVISPCGGRGVCGKCAVTLNGLVSPPNEAEQRAGVRLSCQAILLGDAEVLLPRDQVIDGIELGGSGALAPSAPM